jgi:hypothetical protein
MELAMLELFHREELPAINSSVALDPPPSQDQSAWCQALSETHWLILIKFLEDCGNWTLPYKAVETLGHIFSPRWWPLLRPKSVIQRRFASSLLKLTNVTRSFPGGSTSTSRPDLIQMTLESSIVNAVRFHFDDAEALKTILNTWESTLSREITADMTQKIDNLRKSYEIASRKAVPAEL